MKRLIWIVGLLLVASAVNSQTALVIQLEPADAEKAQKAWIALQKAQADWDATKDTIQKKYLEAGPLDSYSNCLNGERHVKSGWSCGEVEFSPDFKVIVPKTSGIATTVPQWGTTWLCTEINCGPYGTIK